MTLAVTTCWIEPLPQTGTRYQVTREGGSHPLWLPDGQALYLDRGHQMFRLAVNMKDMSARAVPVRASQDQR